MFDMDVARSLDRFEDRRDYAWATSLYPKLLMVIAQDVDKKNRNAHLPIGPPLTEKKLLQFEKRWKIAIPSDYRAYLKYVGDGGAGPGAYEGLLPLAKTVPRNRGSYGDEYLSTPFEHTQPYVEIDPIRSATFEKKGYFNGTLRVGLTEFLVVTGPLRGQIWEDETEEGLYRPTETTFTAWYTRWLDKSCLELYERKMMRARYIDFRIEDDARLGRFTAFLAALQTDLVSGSFVVDDDAYPDLLDAGVRAYFKSSTPEDRSNYAGSIKSDPMCRPKSPLPLPMILERFHWEKYRFEPLNPLENGNVRLSFTTQTSAFGSWEVFVLLDAFGFDPVEAGDGRGPYPRPRWISRY